MTKARSSLRPTSRQQVLIAGAVLGLLILVAGSSVGVLGTKRYHELISTALEALGAAIFFPIVVSYAYDKLRERWLGDEVWRLFSELADAGIDRLYKDRETSSSRDNAQSRLANQFRSTSRGEVLLMGVTLRVFFNPLGPFYKDIEHMLQQGGEKLTVRALISSPRSPEVIERAAVEEPTRSNAPRAKSAGKTQIQRDIDSTVATIRNLHHARPDANISLNLFRPAPYCTAVVFPDVAFYSPNLLAPEAPVRLPMILFRAGSHGYNMILSSFEYLSLPAQSTPVKLDDE